MSLDVDVEVEPPPDAARVFGTSDVAVPVVRGAADDEEVEVSRTTVLVSRPRKSANSTSRTSTATARIPRIPPGKVVVVVSVPVVVVRLSVPVTVVPVVGAGVCAAPASVPPCGALTLPVAPPVVPGVFVFWA
jgi:hypothetical protein